MSFDNLRNRLHSMVNAESEYLKKYSIDYFSTKGNFSCKVHCKYNMNYQIFSKNENVGNLLNSERYKLIEILL